MQRSWQARVVDAAGWLGVVALLSAYALLSASVIHTGTLYHSLNCGGALGVGVSAWQKRSYQAATVEFLWATIALIALARSLV